MRQHCRPLPLCDVFSRCACMFLSRRVPLRSRRASRAAPSGPQAAVEEGIVPGGVHGASRRMTF
jgi:hypothetical protein